MSLGAIEGGVAPVIVLYSSRWIPTAAFGRFSSRSALSMPASVILGAPLSGWLIVNLDKAAGLEGWRWMFIVEGLVTIGVGFAAFRLLPERLADARWLSPPQREWLAAELGRTSPVSGTVDGGAGPKRGLLGSGVGPLVIAWSVTFFTLCMGLYGFIYWLPQVIQTMVPGAGTQQVLLLSAIPWSFAAIGMLVNGWWSDRTLRRSMHVGGAALLSATGLLIAGVSGDPAMAFAGLIVAGLGIGGAQSLFFSIPADGLRGRPKAGFAFACITLAGGLAGSVGANLIGMMRQATGTFSSSFLMLSGVYVIGAVVLLFAGRGDRASGARTAV